MTKVDRDNERVAHALVTLLFFVLALWRRHRATRPQETARKPLSVVRDYPAEMLDRAMSLGSQKSNRSRDV